MQNSAKAHCVSKPPLITKNQIKLDIVVSLYSSIETHHVHYLSTIFWYKAPGRSLFFKALRGGLFDRGGGGGAF